MFVYLVKKYTIRFYRQSKLSETEIIHHKGRSVYKREIQLQELRNFDNMVSYTFGQISCSFWTLSVGQ